MTRTILHHLAAALLAVVGLLPALPASGCTSILVGKKASACGSAFITDNQDDYGMYGRLIYLPAARHAKGDMRRIVNGDNSIIYSSTIIVGYRLKVSKNRLINNTI